MIFLTGGSGHIICIADDNISHVDKSELIGHCDLYLRHIPAKIKLKGDAKQVGEEINRQIRGLFGEEIRQ